MQKAVSASGKPKTGGNSNCRQTSGRWLASTTFHSVQTELNHSTPCDALVTPIIRVSDVDRETRTHTKTCPGGGTEWYFFRTHSGKYKQGRPYSRFITGSGRLNFQDSFYVNFDMSSFDPTNANDKWVMDK